MKTSCKITLEYENEGQSQKILDSIKVDNYDFVKTKKTGKKIIAEIQSNKISSLLHTTDDLLACISVSEKIVK